ILFTNYHRYVDEFVRWGCQQLSDEGPYTALSAAGHVYVTAETPDAEAEGGRGIPLVNNGVGPPNAKTICGHLAVLRPQAWLMIGHCGGLRGSQTIGDYVLGHAYLRDEIGRAHV